MKFSQRKGYKPVSEVLQVEGMSKELRNSIWNAFYSTILEDLSNDYQKLNKFCWYFWSAHLKELVDTIPWDTDDRLTIIKNYFFSCQWYEVYDFVEFVHTATEVYERSSLERAINYVLNRELAGYSLVAGKIVDVTDKQEVDLLDEALKDTAFPIPTAHLKSALELMAKREKPDYRNSIKESISAVEAMARIVTGKTKATLGEALNELEKKEKLHGALKSGFSSLYGYTSDADGIRHSMMDMPNLTAADAKYFLLSCTSFVNYLKSKMM